MKAALYVRTVCYHACPHCATINAITMPTLDDDLSKMDYEVMICFRCKKESSIVDLDDLYPGQNHDEIMLETTDGMKP